MSEKRGKKKRRWEWLTVRIGQRGGRVEEESRGEQEKEGEEHGGRREKQNGKWGI